ncbi:hypothetical protein NE686_02135 [Tissierella carlieri]|uniref:Uncharacterized protein n=1 Tax=Tissierella carlieri TaxID=689904 RepID=A0ABT1S5X5_9FIRM|nr:hypothetical protein [Tissierella carlieri]MCQ4921873.1 hypothetical protein [Tissierella carlieri]
MDKYKAVEKLLYNYKMSEISIENMKEEIKRLEREDGLTAINYDSVKISPTFKISSSTESTMLSILEKIDYLRHSIERISEKLESIDRAMEGLNEVERLVIEKRYIEGLQWWQVAHLVKYSEVHSKRIRKKAINKLVVGLYGENDTNMIPFESK